MTEIYIVYLYCDYRKEVDIQHLCAFKSKDEAIQFANKYKNDRKRNSERYVMIKGTEYDVELFYYDERDEEVDDSLFTENERMEHQNGITKRKEKEKNIEKELNIKKGMWYTRIGIDKVVLH